MMIAFLIEMGKYWVVYSLEGNLKISMILLFFCRCHEKAFVLRVQISVCSLVTVVCLCLHETHFLAEVFSLYCGVCCGIGGRFLL